MITLIDLFKRLWAGWRWLGHKIGRVNGLIILTIFYVVVFTPYAWIVRMLESDVINSRPDATRSSYWRSRSAIRPDSYQRPF